MLLDEYMKFIQAGIESMESGKRMTLKKITEAGKCKWPTDAGDAAELGRQFSRWLGEQKIPQVQLMKDRDDRGHHVYEKT